MPNPTITPPGPPDWWERIPKSVRRRLDLETIVLDALIATDRCEPHGTILALSSLGSYFVAAKRQQARIKRAMSMALTPSKSGRSLLFQDTHFYLIAWTRVGKLAAFIARSSSFRRTDLVCDKYEPVLKARRIARNHLEHFEERLPGGNEVKRLAVPNDLLNMVNNQLTYGGTKIDIGPLSLSILADFVSEFRAALMLDAVEALEKANAEQLVRRIHRAATDVHAEKVTRKIMKELALRSRA